MLTDFRLWLARKLLNTASQLMGEYPMACDAGRRWKFDNDWRQPTLGGSNEAPTD